MEVHLEQGPVLEAAGRRLGAVAAIAGQTRLLAEIVGEQVRDDVGGRLRAAEGACAAGVEQLVLPQR